MEKLDRQFNLRLTDDDVRQIERWAATDARRRSDMIRILLREALARRSMEGARLDEAERRAVQVCGDI